MSEQLFLFKIEKQAEKEKPPKVPKKAKKMRDYELQYFLMTRLYNLTISRKLKGLRYYIENDTQYAEIIGTENYPLYKRIKIYKILIEQLNKNKKYKESTDNEVINNSDLWEYANGYNY